MKWFVSAPLSAVLFFFGTGFHPVPWLTWLAPLPVLVAATRSGGWTAFGAGAAVWLGGETVLWGYFLNTVQIPPPLAVSLLIGVASLFGLVVAGFRALLRRGHALLAAAFVPAAWVVVEYTMSLVTPNGAWWSLAYTQADLLPVLQTASAAGPWGVTFLVMGVPAVVAALLAPGAARRLPLAITATVIFAMALGYGAWRLHAPARVQATKVALLAADRPDDPVDVTTAEGRDLLHRYVAGVPAGVRVVVLPEKAFTADETSLPLLAKPLARLAAERHADIIAGLILTRGGVARNVAIDFPADGGRPVEYAKRHLIPGLESDLRPGRRNAYVPGQHWAIAICFDLDLPGLVRGYRRAGATALFAPGWDFGRDGRLHSRMAVTRGVENGLTIARAARRGELTVSDPYGRVRADARSTDAPVATVITSLPEPVGPTLYARLGDWLAWLCVLFTLAGAAALVRRRRSAPAAGREPAESTYISS